MLCLNIGLLLCSLTSLFATSTSQCDGKTKLVRLNYGFIRSPNFGAEYGKSANCSWTFKRRKRPPHILILNVVQLKLFEVNPGSRYCSSNYNLSINKERYGCDPVRHVTELQPRSCIAFFSHRRCRKVQQMSLCEKRQKSTDDVNVTYVSNGVKTRPTYQDSFMKGFMIEFNVVPCKDPAPTTTTSPRKSVTKPPEIFTKSATTSRFIKSSTFPSFPLNSTTGISLKPDQMKTLQDTFNEESKCVFRSVTCDVAMAMIAAMAGVLGFALGAGCLLIIVKRRDKSKLSDLPGVSGWSITRSVTTVSECAEMRKRTSTDHVYIEANRPSLFEGQYEVPLPNDHYEEPMASKNCKQSVSNDYELMG